MQVTETLSDGLKRAYAVVVPAADIEDRRASRLSELAKQVNLPGFRPGKVPMPIVRQRFGGAVAAEVAEQSINEATQQLLSERALRPAVMPKLEMVTTEPTASGPAKDLEFKVEMELLPEIPMPDFATFTLTRHVAKVPDEEVEKAVADIAERNRELVEFTPEELAARGEASGAAKGDVLTIDFLGKIDGVAFDGMHRDRHRRRYRRLGLHSRFPRADRGNAAGRDQNHRSDVPRGLSGGEPCREAGDVRDHRKAVAQARYRADR